MVGTRFDIPDDGRALIDGSRRLPLGRFTAGNDVSMGVAAHLAGPRSGCFLMRCAQAVSSTWRTPGRRQPWRMATRRLATARRARWWVSPAWRRWSQNAPAPGLGGEGGEGHGWHARSRRDPGAQDRPQSWRGADDLGVRVLVNTVLQGGLESADLDSEPGCQHHEPLTSAADDDGPMMSLTARLATARRCLIRGEPHALAGRAGQQWPF